MAYMTRWFARWPARLRAAMIVVVAALAGLVLGGTSMALWADASTGSGEIHSVYEYFAAGKADDTSPASASDPNVSVTIGSDEAQDLVDDGKIAIGFETDSL